MAQRTAALCDDKYIGIESIYTVVNGRQINIPDKLKWLRSKSQNNELFCPCGCGANLVLVAGDKNLREQHFRIKDADAFPGCHVVTEGKTSVDSKIVLKCWLDDNLNADDLETRVPISAIADSTRKYEFSFISRNNRIALNYCHDRVNLSDEKLQILADNASEILSKLTTGILGAKTFQNSPKWEVEGGPIPRTFFTDRLNNNADKPINDEAVLWLVRLYNAQLGIFKMRKPIDEAKSVKISNELVAYLSEITGVDLLKLKNSYNDSDSAAKRKGLVDVLASVLNSSIDKEYFDPALAASDISNILRNLILGGDFTASLKTACVSEVSGKCPFCNHELVSEDGDEVVESYKIIKFPASGHVDRFEYLAVCNNCYERYKDITKVDLLQCLQDKKKVIVARKSFEKAVDALEMEKEIVQVLDALTVTKPADMPKLQYSPVEVQDKIPDDNMLCSKILTNVVQYFPFVEEKLKELNNERKLTYEKISGDVKRAYLEFASNEDRKEVIFNQLCEWLADKAQTDKKSACEVIISYYVQNCEVFERETT